MLDVEAKGRKGKERGHKSGAVDVVRFLSRETAPVVYRVRLNRVLTADDCSRRKLPEATRVVSRRRHTTAVWWCSLRIKPQCRRQDQRFYPTTAHGAHLRHLWGPLQRFLRTFAEIINLYHRTQPKHCETSFLRTGIRAVIKTTTTLARR